MPEQLTDWSRSDLARLYGCLHVCYVKMRAELNRGDDNIVMLNEYEALRNALARLREIRS